jgi:hypothetical protein
MLVFMRCSNAKSPLANASKFAGLVSRQARARPKRGCALEIGREIRRETAMHLAGDLIGQDLTFPAFEGVERGPHNFLGRTFRRVDFACKVGVDKTCMQPDDLGALFLKLDAKTVGQRPSG